MKFLKNRFSTLFYYLKSRHFVFFTLFLSIILSIMAIPAFGQLTDSDIAALKQRAIDEGWTFTVGKNAATEYPLEQLCGMKVPDNWQELAPFDPCTPTKDLPAAFDWRDSTGCPPIRNQGSCGSCWAFATVGPIECSIKIRDDTTVDISEQWLLSCNEDGFDCTGGWYVFDYFEWKDDPCGGLGSVDEADFPYVATEVACGCPYDHDYLIDSWAYVGNSGSIPSVDAMKQAILDHGPIAVTLHSNSALQAYTGGIFNGCDATGEINHGVTIVGWDDNQGTAGVWFVRNSWGPSWGEDGGYARLEYGCSRIGYAAAYVDYPGNIDLSFEYPSGVPQSLTPGQATSIGVNVSGVNNGVPVPNSGQMHYSINGGALQTVSMSPIYTNQYQATIPPLYCGDKIEFYFSALESTIGRIYDPDTSAPFIAVAVSEINVVFDDNFETDMGWTVSGDATAGAWERGVPVGGGDRGDPPTDFDGSGSCYLTGNTDGDSDVDGGTTNLTSPQFDFSTGDALIHYARWYSNDYGAAPNADEMYVYISNNDGGTWVLVETIGPSDQASGGWYENSFFASDYVTTTNQMRLRFSVSDLGSGSVVEAAVDDVTVTLYSCSVGPPEILTASLPDWTMGVLYSEQLIADGGTGTLTWSDKNGDLTGTGLSLSSTGLLSGTPGSTGPISFTAMVVDEAKASDEKVFSFTINDSLVISTESLPAWTIERPYSQSLQYSGGTSPVTWSDKNNGLSGSGLTLSTSGTISGTPTGSGLISFTAKIVDEAGAVDEQPFDITINSTPMIISAGLPEWTEGRPYSQNLNAFGGTPPLIWIDLNNDLVGTGLSLSTDGLLSGTPNSDGLISFTAHVTDVAGASHSSGFDLDINPHVQITTAVLSDWTENIPYSKQLTSTGGTSPIVWIDKNSDLDGTGLTLSTNGNLTGTPVITGPLELTVNAIDAAGDTAEQVYDFTINQAVVVITETLPDGEEDVAYSQQLESSGGTGNKIWSDKNNDLVSTGLSLSPDGLLTGTPSQSGTINFTARVEDSVGSSDEQELTFEITASFICGDANGDLSLNIFDITYIITYLYLDGPAPDPENSADVDFSGNINIFDITYMITFLYMDGPAPDCP
jgi:hypothetical protein